MEDVLKMQDSQQPNKDELKSQDTKADRWNRAVKEFEEVKKQVERGETPELMRLITYRLGSFFGIRTIN